MGSVSMASTVLHAVLHATALSIALHVARCWIASCAWTTGFRSTRASALSAGT